MGIKKTGMASPDVWSGLRSEGLVTPVVRNADLKGLADISAEVRELAGKARDRTLGLDEMDGSTLP